MGHFRPSELVFPTSEEGEAIKFVYLRTACRSLAVLLFRVFTRVLRVKLSLLDDPVVDPFNCLKLLAY